MNTKLRLFLIIAVVCVVASLALLVDWRAHPNVDLRHEQQQHHHQSTQQRLTVLLDKPNPRDEGEREELEQESAQQRRNHESNSSTNFTNSSTLARAHAVFSSLSQMRTCADKISEGFFWNYRTLSCDPIPGWNTPLRRGEVSTSEMSCTTTSSSSSSSSWLFNAFSPERGVTPENVLDKLGISSSSASPPLPAALKKRYSAFMFFTSWFYRQWLPWSPAPVVPTSSSSTAKSNHRYRGYHDPKLEQLYRVENFCLSPFSGLSGFEIEQAEDYLGRSDTRDWVRHEEFGLRRMLERRGVRSLSAAPDFFDERLVIFFPIQPRSRFNVAHAMHRLLSLIGILRLLESRDLIKKQPSTTAVKPLLVFVSPASSDKGDWVRDEFVKVNVFGFFFRVLDLPIAVVTPEKLPDGYYQRAFNVTGHAFPATAKPSVVPDDANTVKFGVPVKPDPKTERRERQQNRFKKPQAAAAVTTTVSSAAPFSSSSSSLLETNDARVCFRQAVVWQNCFAPHCSNKYNPLDPVETESYSFGNWVHLNDNRRAAILRFRRMFDACVPLLPESPHSSSAATRKPRIFFDVRTAHRGFQNFGLLIDKVRSALVPRFASSIVFRELWRGSRGDYVDHLVSSSDVFVGIHGGSFAQIPLLQPGSVVVEFQPEGFHCNASRPACWFGIFSEAIGVRSHIVVQLPPLSQQLVVSADFVSRVVTEAACTWSSSSSSSSASMIIKRRCGGIRLHTTKAAVSTVVPAPLDLVEDSVTSSVNDAAASVGLSLSLLRSGVHAAQKRHGGTHWRLVSSSSSSSDAVTPQWWQDAIAAALGTAHADPELRVVALPSSSRSFDGVKRIEFPGVTGQNLEIKMPMDTVVCLGESQQMCLFAAVAKDPPLMRDQPHGDRGDRVAF